MFNHSSKPNVGFIRDFKNGVIRYVTLREVKQDEELCISYGSNLWFECDDDEQNTAEESEDDEDLDAEWLGHISLQTIYPVHISTIILWQQKEMCKHVMDGDTNACGWMMGYNAIFTTIRRPKAGARVLLDLAKSVVLRFQ